MKENVSPTIWFSLCLMLLGVGVYLGKCKEHNLIENRAKKEIDKGNITTLEKQRIERIIFGEEQL